MSKNLNSKPTYLRGLIYTTEILLFLTGFAMLVLIVIYLNTVPILSLYVLIGGIWSIFILFVIRAVLLWYP